MLGRNYNGELGIGSNIDHASPQSVYLGVGRTAVSVSIGGSTCAVLDDGLLKCWGGNSWGQLGIGTQTSQNTPQVVSLGGSHGCICLE